MPKTKSLFNINRLVKESGSDVSPEASFLLDFDYTCRKINEYKPYYFFKHITKEGHPEYFDATNRRVDIVCLDTLPEECTEENVYTKNNIIYHTNEDKYYIGVYVDGKPSRTYKPSSLHCIRQMYYQIVGADLDKQASKTGDFYGICECGTDRHKRIQDVICHMREYGVDCDYVDVEDYVKKNNLNVKVLKKTDYETKLFDEKRNIVFLCDGIIKYKGKYYVLEIKTESSYKWMSREYVDVFHKNQAFTYSLELGIDEVMFLYENRDICTKKSYILHVSQEDRDYIVTRINKCNEYVEQNIVPPKEEDLNKKTCQYCDYKTICRVSI